MKEQAVGLNIYDGHQYGVLKHLIGNIIDITESDDDTLIIKGKILPSYQSKIKELLANNIPLGWSIGGNMTDYNQKDDGFEIKAFDLKEISLTGMPANWDTYGTVTTSKGVVKSKCLLGACHTILKNNGEYNMTIKEEKPEPTEESPKETGEKVPLTVEEATQLFNELMADKTEEIKSNVMEAIKQDMKKIIEEEVANAVEGKAPSKNNDDEKPSEAEAEAKALADNITKSFEELEENILKKQEDVFMKYMKESTPTRTTNPNSQKKTSTSNKFTNKDLFESMKQNKTPSLFEQLGITE